MKYVQPLLSQLQHMPTKLERHAFAVDLGSVTTRIARDQKIIFLEPSCVAWHRSSGAVIAIGRQAAELLGKTPEMIAVTFPFRSGKIVELEQAQNFLRSVFQEQQHLHHMTWLTPILPQTISVALSPSATSIQKDFTQRILREVGFTQVTFVNKNKALLQQLRRSKHRAPVLCTMDIGALTTELCIFAQDEPVLERTIHLGGEHFTQEVVRTVRKIHNSEIGWQTAEEMKQTIGRVPQTAQDVKLSVLRGRDISTSLPKTIHVSTTDLDQAFSPLIEDLWNEFRQFCQDGDSEVVTAALNNGIFLTGGGSLLRGLDAFFTTRSQSDVIRSRTPFEDVIKGLVV